MSLQGKLSFNSILNQFLFSSNLATTENIVIENNTNDNTIATAAFIALHMPTGVISPFSGDVAPEGWLICNGSEVLKTSYPKLFSIIGTKYGSASNVNNFVLPDLRGRTVIGANNSYALGNNGGSETVTLSTTNLPSHSHSGTTNTGGEHGHSITDPGHAHSYSDAIWSENGGPVNGPNGSNNNIGTSSNTDYDNNLHCRTVDTSSSTSGVSLQSSGTHSHTFTTENTGEGNAFSIVQPYIAINYIIKYI